MTIRIVMMFPYSGYVSGDRRERIFWKVFETCRRYDAEDKPIVVLNVDTEKKYDKEKKVHRAEAFFNDYSTRRKTELELVEVWSVDTCQMWLHGWGKVLESAVDSGYDRVVLVPGDIDHVSEIGDFIPLLETFIESTKEIMLGDYVSKTNSGKQLIDTYGTYPLLANWFPDVAREIRTERISKPRSEFLNIKCSTLRTLLESRKFAYEQTLNILIRYYWSGTTGWDKNVGSTSLGVMIDDSSNRQYIDCIDQIERTERMLKLLWREINGDKAPYKGDDPLFYDDYEKFDRRSTSIRENAMVALRVLLEN